MSRIEATTLERSDEAGMIVLGAARDAWRCGHEDAAAAPAKVPPETAPLGPGGIWFVGLRGGRAAAGKLRLEADAVLFDAGLNEAIGELMPGSYREIASADPRTASDRLRKLAGEGWRVVRLVDGDPTTMPRAAAELRLLAGSGLRIGIGAGEGATPGGPGQSVIAVAVAFAGPAPRPQLLMTGCNGLAG